MQIASKRYIYVIHSGNVEEPDVTSDVKESVEGVQENALSEAEKPVIERAVKAEKVTASKPDAPHFLLCPTVTEK